jgi:hypothetical protein
MGNVTVKAPSPEAVTFCWQSDSGESGQVLACVLAQLTIFPSVEPSKVFSPSVTPDEHPICPLPLLHCVVYDGAVSNWPTPAL